jgi:hypothetical protein
MPDLGRDFLAGVYDVSLDIICSGFIDDSMAVVARSSVTVRLWIEVCEGIVLPDVTTWCAELSFALAS